jgi:hypothetical protein
VAFRVQSAVVYAAAAVQGIVLVTFAHTRMIIGGVGDAGGQLCPM